MIRLFSVVLLLSAALSAQTPATPVLMSIGNILDRDLTNLERQVVPLAEAMPADKYRFAPTAGEFKTVRTFAQQMSHAAAVLYAASANVLGEKNPSEMGQGANGPASLEGKEAIVKYLKDAFAYAHKALPTVDEKNATELVSGFGRNKVPRLSMATETVWHTYDHYGQSVVYLRLNGIVPPASAGK